MSYSSINSIETKILIKGCIYIYIFLISFKIYTEINVERNISFI